jgi:hypothetical protein
MDTHHFKLPQLNFPEYKFTLIERGNSIEIFDPVRRKYVRLTPEEWVRQHVLQFLIHEKKVPSSLIGVEKRLKIGQMLKRFDVVVFSNEAAPLLLVECKAPELEIRESVFDQAARYNLSLKANYFMITNGLDHYNCRLDYQLKTYVFIQALPEYAAMLA